MDRNEAMKRLDDAETFLKAAKRRVADESYTIQQAIVACDHAIAEIESALFFLGDDA